MFTVESNWSKDNTLDATRNGMVESVSAGMDEIILHNLEDYFGEGVDPKEVKDRVHIENYTMKSVYWFDGKPFFEMYIPQINGKESEMTISLCWKKL